jgi:hypothetical protein
MTKEPLFRRLRIPVKFVDGIWECSYGGVVPVLPDTPGELIIERTSIADKLFLEKMEAKSRHKVLDQGVKLLVSLRVKNTSKIPKYKYRHLVPYDKVKETIGKKLIEKFKFLDFHFIPIYIDKPNADQARKLQTESSGLWLLTQGPEAIGLESTTIKLPKDVWKEPVASLNHAFTKLSEIYEPWRISHTGNIYTRILYMEKDKKWYPLDLLRNITLAEKEQEIAYQLWQDFMKRMSSNKAAQRK